MDETECIFIVFLCGAFVCLDTEPSLMETLQLFFFFFNTVDFFFNTVQLVSSQFIPLGVVFCE